MRKLPCLVNARASLVGCSPLLVLALSTSPFTMSALGQTSTTTSNAVPATAPKYMLPSYLSLIHVALEGGLRQVKQPASIPTSELDYDSTGLLETYQPAGSTATSSNAFFQSLGTNGRSCSSCHEPRSGMSVSATSVQARWLTTLGTDPIFAPVDGANCPSAAGSALLHPANYSLLLLRGLFRIPLPVPANAEFTVKVISDPNGCNTNPLYATSTNQTTGIVSQIVSVYRRSLMAANLKFKTFSGADNTLGFAPPFDLVTLAPFTPDPDGLHGENGNIMSDGREPTLESQAIDATLGHAQALAAPNATQVAQMVAFESGLYSGQYSDVAAGVLSSGGATGGPEPLATQQPGLAVAAGAETVASYDAWNPATVNESARRASVYRGQVLFSTFTFLVNHDEGIDDSPLVNPSGDPTLAVPSTCSTCHAQRGGTTEILGDGQHSIGTAGFGAAFGAPAVSKSLPIFQLTCNAGATPSLAGTVIQVNDPGKALITGKCLDIGRFTTPQLHSLSARAPYFHDGSAATLADVVNFYDTRFNIGFTTANKADLVAFLQTL